MEAWIVITIPGDDNTPPMFAAYNRESRRSGRLYGERSTAARDAKRRNATVQRRASKIERTRERSQKRREAERSERAARLPFIRAIKTADFDAIGIFGDWLLERGDKLGVKLNEIWRQLGNPLRYVKRDALPESKLPHVTQAIRLACIEALRAMDELPKTNVQMGEREVSVCRRVRLAAQRRARKLIREDKKAKADETEPDLVTA